MPWRVGPVDMKVALIIDVVERGVRPEDAARMHGVRRTCAYKWLALYRKHGLAGLEELSRAPYSRPRQTDGRKVQRLLELKGEHPDYGPAKLVVMLAEEFGGHFLAASTAGEILVRHGKVQKRRPRRPGMGGVEHFPFTIDGPGHSMTTDYKGQFRMGDQRYCYPLTIVEPVSRYVLAIKAYHSTAMRLAKRVFDRVFREHGVPTQIISDNGSPFCSITTLGGLTELSKWWVDLGSTPVRIDLGRPQQNGRHERMHRTLKDRITAFPQPSLRYQSRHSIASGTSSITFVPIRVSAKKRPLRSSSRIRCPIRPSCVRPSIRTTMLCAVCDRTVRSSGPVAWCSSARC